MTDTGKKNRILVADDNAFVRFIIKRWLGDVAEIVEIANGKDVVSAYKDQRFDLVLLDIHLPGLSGKDVLKDIRRLDPESYVIMLSADSNKENVVDSIKLGAKAFITKPFTRDTLIRYYNMCPTVMPMRTAPAAPDAEGEANAILQAIQPKG